MSKLRADNITNRAADGAPRFIDGVVVTGVTTSTTFDGNLTGDVTGNITGNVTGNVTGTAATFTTVNATTYIGVPAGFTELDAALFN